LVLLLFLFLLSLSVFKSFVVLTVFPNPMSPFSLSFLTFSSKPFETEPNKSCPVFLSLSLKMHFARYQFPSCENLQIHNSPDFGSYDEASSNFNSPKIFSIFSNSSAASGVWR